MENRRSEAEPDGADESTENDLSCDKSSLPTTTFTAKDNTVSSKTPRIKHQTPTQNTRRQRCGPHRSTENVSVSEIFKRVFTLEMVNVIVRHTNKTANVVV